MVLSNNPFVFILLESKQKKVRKEKKKKILSIGT